MRGICDHELAVLQTCRLLVHGACYLYAHLMVPLVHNNTAFNWQSWPTAIMKGTPVMHMSVGCTCLSATNNRVTAASEGSLCI